MSSSGMPSNPFRILGLDRTASYDDVKAAYKRLSDEYYPESHADDLEVLERYEAVQSAFERLTAFYQAIERMSLEKRTATSLVSSSAIAEKIVPEKSKEPLSRRVSGDNAAKKGGVDVGDAAGSSGGTTERRLAFSRVGAPRRIEPVVAVSSDEIVSTRFGGGALVTSADVITGPERIPPGRDPAMFYAIVDLQPTEGLSTERAPLNLCFVLDHSSSMLRGGKVDHLRETVRSIISQLNENDILSIVTFGDRAEVLLPAQPLGDKERVSEAIDAIHCRGGTEISRGLTAGLSELSRNASRAFSHLILLTDGQTRNDEKICLDRAQEAVSRNITITAYGLGSDWNSKLLDDIACPTGGYSDYIASPEEMRQVFTARIRDLQTTIAHRMTLSIRPQAGYTVRRLTLINPVLRPLMHNGDGGAHSLLIGDLHAGSTYRLLLEFVLGPRAQGRVAVASLAVNYMVPGGEDGDETLNIPLITQVAEEDEGVLMIDPRIVSSLRHATIHRLQEQAWTALASTSDLHKGTVFLKRAAGHLAAEGYSRLAATTLDEVAKIENGQTMDEANVKRIMYGTRRLMVSVSLAS